MCNFSGRPSLVIKTGLANVLYTGTAPVLFLGYTTSVITQSSVHCLVTCLLAHATPRDQRLGLCYSFIPNFCFMERRNKKKKKGKNGGRKKGRGRKGGRKRGMEKFLLKKHQDHFLV